MSREEGEAVIERLDRDALTAEDRRVLVKVLTFYFWLLFALREAKLSLKRLKTLVFGEKPKKREPPESSGSTGGSGGGAGRGPAASPQVALVCESGPTPARERRPGHGRQRADVYQEVKRVECRHEELGEHQRVGEVRTTHDRKTEIFQAFDGSGIVLLPGFLMLSTIDAVS